MIKQITIVIAVRTGKTIESGHELEALDILGEALAAVVLNSALAVHLFVISENNCVLLENTTGQAGEPCWELSTTLFPGSAETAMREKKMRSDCERMIFLDEEFLCCGTQHPELTPWRSLYSPTEISLSELPSCMSTKGRFWLSWDKNLLPDIATTINKQWNGVMNDLLSNSHTSSPQR